MKLFIAAIRQLTEYEDFLELEKQYGVVCSTISFLAYKLKKPKSNPPVQIHGQIFTFAPYNSSRKYINIETTQPSLIICLHRNTSSQARTFEESIAEICLVLDTEFIPIGRDLMRAVLVYLRVSFTFEIDS